MTPKQKERAIDALLAAEARLEEALSALEDANEWVLHDGVRWTLEMSVAPLLERIKEMVTEQ